MSYIDKGSNVIIIDAILTKKGRELLAKGKFEIKKFALSDDEIDYTLWQENHPSGSEFSGEQIEKMPILEPFISEKNNLKYKLITLPRGSFNIPTIVVPSNYIELRANQTVTIEPSTINGNNNIKGYTLTIMNPTIANVIIPNDGKVSALDSLGTEIPDDEYTNITPKNYIGKKFIIKAKALMQTQTTTIKIVGNQTGGETIITLKILASEQIIGPNLAE